MKVSKSLTIGVFWIGLTALTACGGAAGTGASAGDGTATATRSVTGQVDRSAQASVSTNFALNDAQFAVNDAGCDLESDITVRAVPSSGDVVDTTLDTDGFFTLLLLNDRAYSLLFYQNETLCAYLLNSFSGAPSLVGVGANDFDFGVIGFDDQGNFIPENDCEDEYDTDDDGIADSDDDDFDGNGINDDEEDDLDEDGISDEWDCDSDGDGDVNEDDLDDDDDGIEDSEDEDHSGSDHAEDDGSDDDDDDNGGNTQDDDSDDL